VPNGEEKPEQRQAPQKSLALKEYGNYSNCTVVEMTPFDIAILFGKLRPVTDANGQGSLAEMYDRQVYLSHMQAEALYQGLGSSLASLNQRIQQSVTGSGLTYGYLGIGFRHRTERSHILCGRWTCPANYRAASPQEREFGQASQFSGRTPSKLRH
jgi:hypothetical protein